MGNKFIIGVVILGAIFLFSVLYAVKTVLAVDNHVLAIVALGVLFFASAVIALWWSTRQGHFSRLEQTARSIFSDEEPEGVQTDFFPGQAKHYPISKKS